jgi:hypothetical protein
LEHKRFVILSISILYVGFLLHDHKQHKPSFNPTGMMKAFWDQRFSQAPQLYGTAPNQWLSDFVKQRNIRPGSAFLPGEGEGRNAGYLLQHGWKVTAADQSDVAKNHALSKFGHHGDAFQYMLASIESIAFPESHFDLVASIYLHLPIDIRAQIHRQYLSWLKPGGWLLLEGFHLEQLSNTSGGPKDPDMLFTPDMLRLDFEGMDIMYLDTQTVHLNEGIGHSGEARIVRLLARKDPGKAFHL